MEKTNEFINKSRIIHGDKYIYLKTKYLKNNIKVIITCPIHGDFEQTPQNHLEGKGCKQCATEYIAKLRKEKTAKDFKNKANILYRDEYDYSKTKYIDWKTPVEIICKKHGSFWKSPNNHLNGQGCKQCANVLKAINLSAKAKADFVNKANAKHNNFYDYSLTEYKNNYVGVKIICPMHGMFIQTPTDHLRGRGCPKCKQSHLEKEVEILLKENNILFENNKHFNWLGRKHLDFYLPDYNIAIECQGDQHYRPVIFFGGNERYQRQVENDKIKAKKCKDNNIKLLYYSKSKLAEKGTFKNVIELINEIKSNNI